MSENADRWCYTCGAKCIVSEWRGYFDPETGQQYTGIDYRCPNNRWYKFTHTEVPVLEKEGLR